MSDRPGRIQLRRTKGWRKPAGAIIVARPSRWGNPFVVGEGPLTFHGFEHGSVGRYRDGAGGWSDLPIPEKFGLTAAMAVGLYEDLLSDIINEPLDDIDREIAAALQELRGHALCCWCALSEPCHADALLRLANR